MKEVCWGAGTSRWLGYLDDGRMGLFTCSWGERGDGLSAAGAAGVVPDAVNASAAAAIGVVPGAADLAATKGGGGGAAAAEDHAILSSECLTAPVTSGGHAGMWLSFSSLLPRRSARLWTE